MAEAQTCNPAIEILPARGVPRERMPLYKNAADVLVLASVFEGSPNAVKEAMGVNLPVVDVGDVRELIGSIEGCYIVPREAKPMAEKIIEVCRRAGRTRGREAIARLPIEKVAERVVSVYARVAKTAKS